MAQVSYVAATCVYPKNPVPAVNELSLDVADGEFMVLLGLWAAASPPCFA